MGVGVDNGGIDGPEFVDGRSGISGFAFEQESVQEKVAFVGGGSESTPDQPFDRGRSIVDAGEFGYNAYGWAGHQMPFSFHVSMREIFFECKRRPCVRLFTSKTSRVMGRPEAAAVRFPHGRIARLRQP